MQPISFWKGEEKIDEYFMEFYELRTTLLNKYDHDVMIKFGG